VAEAVMRGLRSTIALLVVLVGLGAYIYYGSPGDNSGASDEKRVFQSVTSSDIQELTIKAESGDRTTVRKDGDAWQIVSPIQAAAADSELAAATSALANLDVVRVVDENPADLEQYGLATPRVEVEYKAGDKPAGKILLGGKTPTGGHMYAMKNDEKRVFLISEYQNASLNKSTFDLRDKSVMKIERDKVDGVEVSIAGKAGFQFAKKNEEWKLTQPVAASADFGTVESLVGRVQTAQMKTIVTEQPSPADLKKFGLERPEVTVTLNMGSARATLALGAKAGDDGVYARDTSKNMVVTVEPSLADDLRKPVDDYRRREAFEFRAFTANRVELTRPGSEPVVFERVKGEGENAQDTWKRVSPNAADVDKAKMDAFLAGLADIRATSFTDTTAKTGLDRPALTVYAKFEDNKKEERVTFGQVGNNVYFARPGEPGAAQAEAEKFTDAIKALDELAK
jgi:hypothetical protein